jgi:hypothetical protein
MYASMPPLSPTSTHRRTVIATLAIAAWLSVVAAALVGLTRYKSAPGTEGDVPSRWPAAAAAVVALDHDRATVLMFVHARCPCTRASLEELSKVLARHPHDAAVHIVADQRSSSGARDTLSRARALRDEGVLDIIDDADGSLARTFGAETSGAVVVYGADGVLRFHGGITASRGHEGDNHGADALAQALLTPAAASPSWAPTFGCGLFDSEKR